MAFECIAFHTAKIRPDGAIEMLFLKPLSFLKSLFTK